MTERDGVVVLETTEEVGVGDYAVKPAVATRFCKNDDGDCPCLEWGHWPAICRLNPVETNIRHPEEHWCYLGRQIMEIEWLNRLTNILPKEGK